jgi:hypothetical protein
MKAAIKATVATLALLASGSGALAEVSKTPVTVANFVRAESDHMIRANMEMVGVTFGKFVHLREPTTPDNQPVIRMNQDTLYSATVLDLSKPVTITLPEIGGRYMSMHVVNQDHYCFVEAKPGTYKLTEDTVGTRFAYVTVRTFYNAGDPDDLAKAHAAQDRSRSAAADPARSRRRIGTRINWRSRARHSANWGNSDLTPPTPSAPRKRSGRSIISSPRAPAGAACRTRPPSTSWRASRRTTARRRTR